VNNQLVTDLTRLQIIVYDTCVEFNTEQHYLLHGGNHQALVNVRRKIAWRARAEGYSLPQIGRALNRHHTTVLNLLRKP
jgi:chromosomal replication initiation ATPase DnaA